MILYIRLILRYYIFAFYSKLNIHGKIFLRTTHVDTEHIERGSNTFMELIFAKSTRNDKFEII